MAYKSCSLSQLRKPQLRARPSSLLVAPCPHHAPARFFPSLRAPAHAQISALPGAQLAPVASAQEPKQRRSNIVPFWAPERASAAVLTVERPAQKPIQEFELATPSSSAAEAAAAAFLEEPQQQQWAQQPQAAGAMTGHQQPRGFVPEPQATPFQSDAMSMSGVTLLAPELDLSSMRHEDDSELTLQLKALCRKSNLSDAVGFHQQLAASSGLEPGAKLGGGLNLQSMLKYRDHVIRLAAPTIEDALAKDQLRREEEGRLARKAKLMNSLRSHTTTLMMRDANGVLRSVPVTHHVSGVAV